MKKTLFDKKKYINFLFVIVLLLISSLLTTSIYKMFNEQFGVDIYAIYSALISILLLFLIIIFLFFKSHTQNIFVAIISTILSLYICEFIIFSLKFYPKKFDIELERVKKAKARNIEFDSSNIFEFYNKLKIHYPDTNYYLHISTFASSNGLDFKGKKIFPLSGIANIETVFCNENGYWTHYRSDKYGFNNPNYRWNAKYYDAVLIGDSFIHGACLKNDKILANLLENEDLKVLNLGFSGNGTLMYYATMKEFLINKNFKNILIFHYEGNDLNDLSREMNSDILNNYLNDDRYKQGLKGKQATIDTLSKNFIKKEFIKKDITIPKKDNYNILQFIKLTKSRSFINFTLPISYKNKKLINKFSEIMTKNKIFSDKNNAKIYLIYLPAYSRFDSITSRILLDLDKNKIKNIANSIDIEFIDIAEEFKKNSNDPKKYFPFELNGHYTEEGVNLVFDTLKRKIVF